MNWMETCWVAVLLFALGCGKPTPSDPSSAIDSASVGHQDVATTDGTPTDVDAAGGPVDGLSDDDVRDAANLLDVAG